MSEKVYFYLALLAMGVVGYLVARCRYRRLMWETQGVHELCEDASYRAGLARGREEGAVTIGGGDAWYRKGFKDGQAAERVEVQRYLDKIGVRKC